MVFARIHDTHIKKYLSVEHLLHTVRLLNLIFCVPGCGTGQAGRSEGVGVHWLITLFLPLDGAAPQRP